MSSPVIVLLIGGNSDGRRVAVERGRSKIIMPVLQDVESVRVDTAHMAVVAEQTYHIERIGGDMAVAVLDGLGGHSVSDLMRLLVNGYREQQQ